MLLSINWLKTFIPQDIPVHDIAEKLTMAGLEVEEIVKKGASWEHIVVGEILEIAPHPNADKLAVTKVSASGQVFSVVCGAPNIRTGQKIPLALPGAVVAGGFQIKKSKIRGEVSEGMICSEPELELGEDAGGIMVLSPDSVPGTPLATALNLSDTILDINVTPNRPDCLSVLGIAREVAALFDTSMSLPPVTVPEEPSCAADAVSVEILAPKLCPRYCARVADNIRVAPSPLWMRKRLEYCGIRPINNIVDITNFVLLEWGQPLHAFDYEKLTDSAIVVRTPKPGERIITLDEVERPLPEDVLLICSRTEPVAIAGIMGGEASGITDTTEKILIESAYFLPSSIASSSRKLKLKTEASIRFEKGVDIHGVIPALNRVSALLAEISDIRSYKGLVDAFPAPPDAVEPVAVSVKKTNAVTGFSLSAAEAGSILRRLNFTVTEQSSDLLQISVPSYRQDISLPEDIIEEIARLKGYQDIPVTFPPVHLSFPSHNTEVKFTSCLRDYFISQGFHETVNFSFYSPEMITMLNLPEGDTGHRPVNILNPLSSSLSVLRTSLIPSLLVNLKDNLHLRDKSFKLFEIANVFSSNGADRQPTETKKTAGIMAGLTSGEFWNRPPGNIDFFDMKGCMENLFDRLNINTWDFARSPAQPFLHPKKNLTLTVNGQECGFLGEMNPFVLEKFDIETEVFVFELDFKSIFKHYSNTTAYRPFAKTPFVQRDIALVVDDATDASELLQTIRTFKNDLVKDISFFDYYKGPNIDHHKKSLAYRIMFQSDDRTLTDSEVNRLMEKLLTHIKKRLNVDLRQ